MTSNSKLTAAWVMLVAITQSTGCYSTFDIRQDTLSNLDGFGVAQTTAERTVERPHPTDPNRKIRVILPPQDPSEKKYWLTTKENETVAFDTSSTLLFVGKDGLRISSQFDEIKIKDGILQGLQFETKTPIFVDLNQVFTTQATVRSPGKSALLVLGVTAAIVLTGGLFVVAAGFPG